MADFVARLDGINALADEAPGFVWRHVGEDGYQDGGDLWGPDFLVNLSVWESVEALAAFTYESAHRGLLAARRRWFRPMAGPHLVLWWVPAGHIPDLREAKARLDALAADGPGPEAFDFADPFGADREPLRPARPPSSARTPG